jgi:hypothetical protein
MSVDLRSLRLGRIVGGIALAGLTVAVATACGPADHVLKDGMSAPGPVTEVRLVEGGSGDVTVTVDPTVTEIVVKRTVHYVRSAPAMGAAVASGVLTLPMDCGSMCGVSYEVRLPAAAAVSGRVSSGDVTLTKVARVEVSASSGDITVSQVSGPVSVETSSGDIRLTDVGGAVTAKATSGDIQGVRLSGQTTTIEATSGTIDVSMAGVDDVSLTATSGDINLRVPGGPYRVDTEANSGDITVSIATDPAAAHHIVARANSGDITIGPA